MAPHEGDSLKKLSDELHGNRCCSECEQWDWAARIDALRSRLLDFEDEVSLQDASQDVRMEWRAMVEEIAGMK